MKEFSAQTGGRYTYADDLENLQELALAFSQLFDDCDDFIVSGCEVTSNAVSPGYVFLNGKMRYFSGATGVTSWPQYLYESNSEESVTYESGGSKTGRKIYGCALASSVPAVADALTGKISKAITITSTGGLQMKDAFIGKYAVLLNPSSGAQTVDNAVTFTKAVAMDEGLVAKKPVSVKSGTNESVLGYDGSAFSITSTYGSNVYRLSLSDGEGFRFYVNGTLIATIGHASITFAKPVTASQGTFGGLVLTGNHIYQGTANAESDVYINQRGYNGGYTQFRNTSIGNGKDKFLIRVIGSEGSVNVYGQTRIAAGTMDGLVLKAAALKSNNTLVNAIAWKDSSNADMARVGFLSSSDQSFSITASYNINITANGTVDIGPAIKENGQLLSEKYVTRLALNEILGDKAGTDQVYTIEQADAKFAMVNRGLAQFVDAASTQAICRSQIGAAGKADLDSYAKLENCLSDMAATEANKKKIRDNIGAAATGDFQLRLTDSGWVHIQDALYVRQIGNIVCVQGSTKTVHSGAVFTIPNLISAPTYPVKHTVAFSNNRSWTCKIAAGQRACTVVYCDGSCNKMTEISITYMV